MPRVVKIRSINDFRIVGDKGGSKKSKSGITWASCAATNSIKKPTTFEATIRVAPDAGGNSYGLGGDFGFFFLDPFVIPGAIVALITSYIIIIPVTFAIYLHQEVSYFLPSKPCTPLSLSTPMDNGESTVSNKF